MFDWLSVHSCNLAIVNWHTYLCDVYVNSGLQDVKSATSKAIFESLKLKALLMQCCLCIEHCEHTCWVNYSTGIHSYEERSGAADAGSRWCQCKYTSPSSIAGMPVVVVLHTNVFCVLYTSSHKSTKLNCLHCCCF